MLARAALRAMRERGALELKGVAEPIRAWTVEWREPQAPPLEGPTDIQFRLGSAGVIALGIALYLNKTPIPFMSGAKPAAEEFLERYCEKSPGYHPSLRMDRPACPFLTEDQRCAIYAVRLLDVLLAAGRDVHLVGGDSEGVYDVLFDQAVVDFLPGGCADVLADGAHDGAADVIFAKQARDGEPGSRAGAAIAASSHQNRYAPILALPKAQVRFMDLKRDFHLRTVISTP